MKDSFLLLSIFLITSTSILADKPDTLWTKWYGGESYDYTYNICETQDGGFISCGISFSFGSGINVYIVRMDSKGDTLWTDVHGSPDSTEYVYSMEETEDGGYILCGTLYDKSNFGRV